MNAMSMAPPIPTTNGGSPLANVVTSPVLGSMREILPAAPSVTKSAPPGPTALPDPLARPVTSSVAVGVAVGGRPMAADRVVDAISAAAPNKVSILLLFIVLLLSPRGIGQLRPPQPGVKVDLGVGAGIPSRN